MEAPMPGIPIPAYYDSRDADPALIGALEQHGVQMQTLFADQERILGHCFGDMSEAEIKVSLAIKTYCQRRRLPAVLWSMPELAQHAHLSLPSAYKGVRDGMARGTIAATGEGRIRRMAFGWFGPDAHNPTFLDEGESLKYFTEAPPANTAAPAAPPALKNFNGGPQVRSAPPAPGHAHDGTADPTPPARVHTGSNNITNPDRDQGGDPSSDQLAVPFGSVGLFAGAMAPTTREAGEPNGTANWSEDGSPPSITPPAHEAVAAQLERTVFLRSLPPEQHAQMLSIVTRYTPLASERAQDILTLGGYYREKKIRDEQAGKSGNLSVKGLDDFIRIALGLPAEHRVDRPVPVGLAPPQPRAHAAPRGGVLTRAAATPLGTNLEDLSPEYRRIALGEGAPDDDTTAESE